MELITGLCTSFFLFYVSKDLLLKDYESPTSQTLSIVIQVSWNRAFLLISKRHPYLHPTKYIYVYLGFSYDHDYGFCCYNPLHTLCAYIHGEPKSDNRTFNTQVNLAPMGFKVSNEGEVEPENPDAEYFGARSIHDFTWKDLLSFESCTECRRCTDICPANNIEKKLDPRSVILKLRDSMRVEAQMLKTTGTDSHSPIRDESHLYENNTINHEEIWACTNCGACVSECPVGIDQPRAIMELKRYQAMTLGDVPPEAANAIQNIQVHNNPWGVSADDRFKWADGLNIPIITEASPEVEWLYYVGCAGSYDSANQQVARSLVNLLKAAEVDFAVMGKAESCTGEPSNVWEMSIVLQPKLSVTLSI